MPLAKRVLRAGCKRRRLFTVLSKSKGATMERVTPHIGLEITNGQHLLETEAQDELYHLLLKNHVLFFRLDDPLTPEHHQRIAESFGTLERPHPVYEAVGQCTVLESSREKRPDADEWHQDCTFEKNPPFVSVLQSIKVPEVGGDTMWLSAFAAYDDLPEGIKQELEGLHAVHDLGTFRNNFSHDEQAEGAFKVGAAVHPVVQTHPVTGKKYLMVSESFTSMILGMPKPYSSQLLDFLFTSLKRPEYACRFRWRQNSLAIWTNWGTQHYAINDYWPHYRRMHRITALTDRRLE